MKIVIKRLLFLLTSAVCLFDIFLLCLWVHSFHYYRPFGGREITIDEVLLVSDVSDAEKICSKKELLPELQKCRFRGVSFFTGIKILHNLPESDVTNVFSIYNTDKNVSQRDHGDVIESFGFGDLIRYDDELYLRCDYICPVFKYSNSSERMAFYKVQYDGEPLDFESEIFDGEYKIDYYLEKMNFASRTFRYYIEFSPVKYVLISYGVVVILAEIVYCMIMLKKKKTLQCHTCS